ncbi:exportin-4-like [Uloborus diversus]|uniref:exportin-4-like n=1 Tax=Uloborus diversus TaxID=327109 RepID=UPI00240A7892|nr:exportin-4-like [Uloborus diversus]
MAEQIIRELEAAAEILMAPPNVVSSEQRHCAESVFMNFQKTRSPFHLCQLILANSRSDYVQFQAGSLLKQAIIREWKEVDKGNLVQLRTGLLNFVVQNPTLQNYVREQLLLVVAIMVKRASVEETESKIVGEFLNEVSQLISSGDAAMQVIGCSILTALLNEFSSSTRASDVGLTWETHLTAKRRFERNDLKRLFQFCLQGLSELNKVGGVPPETARLFKKFLIIAEQVLTWNFQFAMLLPRKLVGMFESQQCPALRPTVDWHEVFVDPTVIQLFYKLHWQVREIPDLCHHTLQCLHQLSSLNGQVLSKKEDRLSYLRCFVENLVHLLNGGPLRDHEVIGISNMLSRLHVFFPALYINSLPPEILQAYLSQMTALTCKCIDMAAHEDKSQDDRVYNEGFEHLLDAWQMVLQDNQYFAPELVQQASVQIFNQYLKTHLSPPEGTRPQSAPEEIEEVEENDRTKYWDQLSAIGLFARHILHHCVPILVRLLEDRLTRLHGQLQRMQQCGGAEDNTILEMLNEDIHWLLLISGHVLSSVSEGETSLIPLEIIRYSMSQTENVNIETTLRVLASPSHRVCDIPGAETSTDPVVRLVAGVFRLCEVERRALEANLSHLMSPEVGTSLAWFLGRFAVTYLMPNEAYYSEMSLSLTQAFGKDTEAGRWTLDFVIGKLESDLLLWPGEVSLLEECCSSLGMVLNNSERGEQAITCTSFLSLLKRQQGGVFHALPPVAKRQLLKSLVLVGAYNENADMRKRYWMEVLKPLQERLQALVCSPSTLQAEAVDLLECIGGLLEGCSPGNLGAQGASLLVPLLSPLFPALVKLMERYHSYGQVLSLLFGVLCIAAKRILCYLAQSDANNLYKCCIDVISIYAKHNTGRLSQEVTAEEDQFQDLLALMQLLTDLLFRDFIEFGPSQAPTPVTETGEPCCTAADVVLFGLNIIMPLMSKELLNFPTLCTQYYKLITFVCEIHPNKLFDIEENLFKSLFNSVRLGLTSFTPEITSLCLDYLSILGLYVINHMGTNQHPNFTALEPFIKILLEMLLFQPLDTDLTQAGSSTLYTLICCFHAQYKSAVAELVESRPEPEVRRRLGEAFTLLDASITLSLDRYSRIKFRDELERFVTEARGYLCVK